MSGDVQNVHNEARAIDRLIHPHIVRVLDFGLEESIPYLVMEFAPDGTLRQRHPKGIVVPLPQIAKYVRQIASALQYAHTNRLIHSLALC
ncbi:MAG: protein kinase [Ktedonobacteraceae bacterium]